MTTVKAIKTSASPHNSQLMDVDPSTLGSGDVTIRCSYSAINYKDALAITGKGRILKSSPLVPGIDASGTITDSKDPRFSPGQRVLVTGCGLGEHQDGGFAEVVRVPADWVIPLPEGLSLKEAIILGTAGFTAGLCLMRMKQMDQTPDKGPIAITGASGGVGTIATQLFSQAGFEVIAISNKSDYHSQLKELGASQTLTPEQLQLGRRPLESARFGGVVDNVGGELLAQLMAHIHLWGNVACVGLAASHELHTTVMPLILRGVSLLGISSANCPLDMRQQLWSNLGTTWKPRLLEKIVSEEISLKEVFSKSESMINQKTFGRIVVKIS